jgi:hypothetical protein
VVPSSVFDPGSAAGSIEQVCLPTVCSSKFENSYSWSFLAPEPNFDVARMKTPCKLPTSRPSDSNLRHRQGSGRFSCTDVKKPPGHKQSGKLLNLAKFRTVADMLQANVRFATSARHIAQQKDKSTSSPLS